MSARAHEHTSAQYSTALDVHITYLTGTDGHINTPPAKPGLPPAAPGARPLHAPVHTIKPPAPVHVLAPVKPPTPPPAINPPAPVKIEDQ
eukprot:gene11275-3315_t